MELGHTYNFSLWDAEAEGLFRASLAYNPAESCLSRIKWQWGTEDLLLR